MKFETTRPFERDWKRLKPEHKSAFRAAVPAFSAACDAYADDPGGAWPAALRVAPMAGTKGIWAMTWSFASPDGRATFEFVTVDGEVRCRWRRVGGHRVFARP